MVVPTRRFELGSGLAASAVAEQEFAVALAYKSLCVEDARRRQDRERLAIARIGGAKVALGLTDLRQRDRGDVARLGISRQHRGTCCLGVVACGDCVAEADAGARGTGGQLRYLATLTAAHEYLEA